MSSKIRKQIYIEPHQDTLLKTIAQQAGISEAEIIRQALNRHLGTATSHNLDLTAWENEKVFIEKVKNRSPKAEGRDWQRDDLYER